MRSRLRRRHLLDQNTGRSAAADEKKSMDRWRMDRGEEARRKRLALVDSGMDTKTTWWQRSLGGKGA